MAMMRGLLPHRLWRCAVSTLPFGTRPPGAGLRPCPGGWFLLVLFLQSSCATVPRTHGAGTGEPGLGSATVYVVDFMEPGASNPQPVPIPRSEFQRAFQRLARDVR